jgi:hypothetical protein
MLSLIIHGGIDAFVENLTSWREDLDVVNYRNSEAYGTETVQDQTN